MLLRVVLFGGKGGVGKSTLACATALKLAKESKTLLISIDLAHSLSGILQTQIGNHLSQIKENLFAIELIAEDLVGNYANRVLSALGEMLPSLKSGLEEYAKHLKHSPTALETAVLDRLADYFNEDFRFVVIDSAPTGQMVRLFQTLKTVRGWFSFLERLAKEREKVETFMGREDRVLKLMKMRKEKVERLANILMEKGIIFAVANEDPLSIDEAVELERQLLGFKVYRVMNKCKSERRDFLKVEHLEKPYGIEKLSLLNIEDLLRVIEV